MARSVRKRKRGSGRELLTWLVVVAELGVVVVAGYYMFREPILNLLRPPRYAKAELAQKLRQTAEDRLLGDKLSGLGRLASSEELPHCWGSTFKLSWEAFSAKTLPPAAAEIKTAWQKLDPRLVVSASDPKPVGIKLEQRLIAVLDKEPLVELTLYTEAAPGPAAKLNQTTPRPSKSSAASPGKVVPAQTTTPGSGALVIPKQGAPALADDPTQNVVQAPAMVIIIDDIGNDLRVTYDLLSIGAPLTFSVLPYSEHAEEACDMIGKAGGELMLHMPMEPEGYPDPDPGKGALLLGTDPQQIRLLVRDALAHAPGAVGVNNHMGSAFTLDREEMRVFLDEVKRRRLFFIDSLTIGGSVGYDLAVQMGIPAAKRAIFLDHEISVDYTQRQLLELAKDAAKNGVAVGIGHPRPETIAALKVMVPLLLSKGLRIIHASEAVR